MQVLSVDDQLVCGDAIEVGVREKPGTVHGGLTTISAYDRGARRDCSTAGSAASQGPAPADY
jgi:hypothetical protein